jgi:DNA (cytosine-5)-methyltransferase 1
MFQSLGARDVEEGAVMPATKPIALADISSRDKSQNGSGWKDDGTMYTLDTTGLQGVAQPIPLNTMNVMRSPDAAASTGCGVGEEGEAMFTLTKGNSHAVAQPIGAFKSGQGAASRSIGWSNAIAPTLPSNAGGNTAPAVLQSMAVRRLTPVECERLQGFPDGYTNIPWRKQPESPDGPRYKALGNSMAVPVMGWIGKRIQIRVGA